MLVSLNDILYDARKNRYGVGLFNTIDTDNMQAAIEAAEELRSPIIIGTAEVLLPYGELSLIAPSMLAMAKKASVPVVVHFDHGLTFGRCMEALKLGFSSVMFDGSAHNYEENIRATREMVKIAHSMGATVEGEIGHVGEACDNDDARLDLYTTAEDAKSFIADTGVDALAISIGTAHGKYIKKPRLDIERLKEIYRAVEIPLVLHGGSGLSDADFKNCVSNGISKVNIFTDICTAGIEGIRDGLGRGMDYTDLRNNKIKYIKEAVKNKMVLFGSDGKA